MHLYKAYITIQTPSTAIRSIPCKGYVVISKNIATNASTISAVITAAFNFLLLIVYNF